MGRVVGGFQQLLWHELGHALLTYLSEQCDELSCVANGSVSGVASFGAIRRQDDQRSYH